MYFVPIVLRHVGAPLFPYTTLFRSEPVRLNRQRYLCRLRASRPESYSCHKQAATSQNGPATDVVHDSNLAVLIGQAGHTRSDEHTSELQSHSDPGSRRLLEKRNPKS